jgi:hypothetical protein
VHRVELKEHLSPGRRNRGKMELIAGTAGTTQPQPIKAHDAFEMGKLGIGYR